MNVESTRQALCDMALRFGEGREESMVITAPLLINISGRVTNNRLNLLSSKKFRYVYSSMFLTIYLNRYVNRIPLLSLNYNVVSR
ncbi:hypothetical protein EUTSA_v10001161mg [Eutrema salsugineum]|uniref:Uncharacterized protein n=1 Tax=Eutrema salsugineum TaxID=72664 RepID=V4LID3_EUTSA|nr:hypothetical protein EUTSA_v10001161mg [Eutrema salsugineum]